MILLFSDSLSLTLPSEFQALNQTQGYKTIMSMFKDHHKFFVMLSVECVMCNKFPLSLMK